MVIYCTAGISRSSSIVIGRFVPHDLLDVLTIPLPVLLAAYAIKHLKMSLAQAFRQVQAVRMYARPSLAFFHQLVQYENDCLGVNSVQMVAVPMAADSDTKAKKDSAPHQSIVVPDIYSREKDYLHLLQLEVSAARKGTCQTSSDEKLASNKANQGQCDDIADELKPFLVGPVSYEAIVSELKNARLIK